MRPSGTVRGRSAARAIISPPKTVLVAIGADVHVAAVPRQLRAIDERQDGPPGEHAAAAC
jgi:hypothetical protein